MTSQLSYVQILKVMQEEAKNTGKTEEIALKILAHNNLIGRIIGKQVNHLEITSFMKPCILVEMGKNYNFHITRL